MTNRYGIAWLMCIPMIVVACASSAGQDGTSAARDDAAEGAPVDDVVASISRATEALHPPEDEARDDGDDPFARVDVDLGDEPPEESSAQSPPDGPPLPGADEVASAAPVESLATDCPASDDAGRLVWKAQHRKLYDAHLSYRQTNDAGQSLARACNLRTHEVTSEGMRNVALHCMGRSQAQMGYARVGAAWGTREGAPSCTKNVCAAIYVRRTNGTLREVVRNIHIADRFFCSQTRERTDERLDVDACTYADVLGALKHTGPTDDASNLAYDANWKLTGNPRTGESLKYELYECAAGPRTPGACNDKPTPKYTCAQQRGWGKCGASWMTAGGYCARTCGRC